MAAKFQKLTLTETVHRAQEHYYGRFQDQDQDQEGTPENDPLTGDEVRFIQARDSFYMATVSEAGWPYIQHRGGQPGFLRVLGPATLGFADYKGNRQLLSTGNLTASDKVALFLMDYPQRARLKILGHARVEDAREHPDLVAQLAEPAVQNKVERLFFIDVVSFDWNCPQYITPRYTLAEIKDVMAELQEHVAELNAQPPTKN
jgi:predicted pyridoxine 5'-phosphate oxidase superfamily flavin-nucleotide-binding protein